MKTALVFFVAILSEVIATSALKFSDGFTKIVPSVIVVVGYGFSFYLISLILKELPIGTTYAIWSGVGIILTAIIGMIFWHEQMDWARGLGITLIIAGIVLINLFSKTPAH